jgi:hypothetical protein
MTSFLPEDHTDPADPTEELPGRVRGRTARRATILTATLVGAGLAVGGVAWAASGTGSGSGSSASGAPAGYGPPGAGHAPTGARPTGTPPTGTPPTGTPPKHTPKHTPILIGTVKSSGGGSILITDFDGFTRTIKVSASTKYENSLTATPKVGTVIEAEGTVDADSTSLDATVVETPTMPGGPGGPGRLGGPGRPDGPGAGHPGAPHGTASAAPKPTTSPTS